MTWLTQEMSELAGGLTPVVSVVSVGAGLAAVQIAQRNPLRWGLWIGYDGQVTGQVQIAPSDKLTAADGWQLLAGTPLSWNFRANPAITTAAWFAGNTGAAAVKVLVIEEIAIQ